MTRVERVNRRGSGIAHPSVEFRKLQLSPPLQRPLTFVSGSMPGYSLPGIHSFRLRAARLIVAVDRPQPEMRSDGIRYVSES